jgi:hypothetical protein
VAATPRLSDRRVRLIRQTAHLLHRPRRRSVPDIVRHLVGVQAQDSSAAPLAIRARAPGLTAGDVARALVESRLIVRTWAMRGTLHLVATEDVPWIVPLTAEASLVGSHRRLAQEGVTLDQAERAVRSIGRMLAAHGPLTRAEIVERLGPTRIRTAGQAAIHLIRLAALQGILCYGPDRDGEPTFVAVRDWLEPRPGAPIDRHHAPARLAERYLAAHAPAAPEDFASWSGLRAGDARRGWEQLAGRLREVEAPGKSLWTLRSRRDPPAVRAVRLVPAFDPYLLGWKGRELSLPKEHERKVFPGGGLLRPAVVSDGLVVGTWTVRRRTEPLRVTIGPFSRPGPALRRAVKDDAEDLARFLGRAAGPAVEWDGP